jgi:hypothetical protein
VSLFKKRFFLLGILFVGSILFMAQPLLAEARDVRVDLGADENKLRWYMVKVDEVEGMPVVTLRVYYAVAQEKKKMAQALVSEAEVDEAKAERLYFTEYDYVFHSTDNTYAIYAARHYDMGGHEIFSAGVNFHDMQWMEIIEKSIPFKAKAAYNKL